MKSLNLVLGAAARRLARLFRFRASKEPPAIPIGEEAPPFTLPDSQGNRVSLSDFRGRHVILVFYPGDSTPVCSHQLTEIERHRVALDGRGIDALGINPAPARLHERFRCDYDLRFPLLIDDGLEVAKAYGARFGSFVRRTVVLIDPRGHIVLYRRGAPTVETILGTLPEKQVTPNSDKPSA